MASIVNLFRLLFTLTALCYSTTAIPLTKEAANPSQAGTKPPDQDEFYKPPRGYESAAPGSILRYRPVPNGITLNNKTPILPKAAWQILYRTQNSVGEPEASVVTVLVPHKAKTSNLFVYSYFTLAAYNGCNPSINMQIGARDDAAGIQMQIMVAVMALDEGWYVSIADDTGPQAAFSAGPQSGYATLDSIRAVKQSGNFTGISSEPLTTIFGYSAAAGSAGWATELQPRYAPDVKIAGAALGGMVPNGTFSLEVHNAKPWSMFGPATLLGLSHDYANLSKWLNENLLPERAEQFRKAERSCFGSYYDFDGQDVGMYLKGGVKSLYEPVPSSVMNSAGTMGLLGTPTIPWYIYHTDGDDGAPVIPVDLLVEKHCKNGATIEYQRNPANYSHRDEALFGYSTTWTWVRDRHAGKSVTPGCKTAVQSMDLSWLAAQGPAFEFALANFLAFLGSPLGKSI